MKPEENIIEHLLPDIAWEKLNSRIHSAGIVLGFGLLPILLFLAWDEGIEALLATGIYGLCFIATFSLSCLFHSCRVNPRRERLKTLDRISIYFLIAGSYTPIVIYYLQNQLGLILLTAVWVLAIAGIFFEIFLVKKYFFISVPFYLVMGCLFIFTAGRFFAGMPRAIILLILVGVVLYIAGVFFFINERKKYYHAIWHSFVLVAALCHYTAILITARG